MEQPTMELKVPAAIYERAATIASESDRSAESVILDGLSLLFGTLPDMELEPEALKDFWRRAAMRACASSLGMASRHAPARTHATRSIGASH